MTMVFNHTKHKELWNWLADNPGKFKFEWPGWDKETDDIDNKCYACEAVRDTTLSCNGCPLVWNSKEKISYCSLGHGLYTRWKEETRKMVINMEYNEENKNKISKLAKKIANLPLRTDIQFEVI